MLRQLRLKSHIAHSLYKLIKCSTSGIVLTGALFMEGCLDDLLLISDGESS